MDVQIKELPALRVAAVRHIGPYEEITEAFERLGEIAGPAGMTQSSLRMYAARGPIRAAERRVDALHRRVAPDEWPHDEDRRPEL